MRYISTTTIFRHDRNIEKDCFANLFVFGDGQYNGKSVLHSIQIFNDSTFLLLNWKYEINSEIGVNWRFLNFLTFHINKTDTPYGFCYYSQWCDKNNSN